MRLLAEPRQYVSYREICRQCHVTDDTVKAIEQREAIPIATRKQTLMEQAARIARLAADRVEEQIDSATLPQAVVAFGVMTDKVRALSDDPAIIIQHEHQHLHAHTHHFQPINEDTIDAILAQLPDDDPPPTPTTPIDSSFSQIQETINNSEEIPAKPVATPVLSSDAAGMHSHSQTDTTKKGLTQPAWVDNEK